MLPDEGRIAEAMARALKPARFEHTRGVVAQADRLAKRHGAPRAKARLAAWLHDGAKQLSPARMRQAALLAGADAHDLASPSLWHSAAGKTVARRHGVRDPAVLAAIRWHTTGSPGMGLLARILYVADYTEPGRRWKGLKQLRSLAERDLDLAYGQVLAEKIADLLERGLAVHPRSLAAWNHWVRRKK